MIWIIANRLAVLSKLQNVTVSSLRSRSFYILPAFLLSVIKFIPAMALARI